MKSGFMKSYRSFPSLYKPAPNKTALRATSGTLRANLSGPLIDKFEERHTATSIPHSNGHPHRCISPPRDKSGLGWLAPSGFFAIRQASGWMIVSRV